MGKTLYQRFNKHSYRNADCFHPKATDHDFFASSFKWLAKEASTMGWSHSATHSGHCVWIPIKKTVVEISPVEKQFNELAANWRRETGVYSTMLDKINDSYLEIIGMGKDVIPFMLKDMLKPTGTAHWHTALKALTKDDPVLEEDLNKPKKIKQAWIEWGVRKRII
jgi:hypothetical protein